MPAGALLVLEASTAHGSVAIVRGDVVLAHTAVAMGVSRDDHLFPAVQSLLATCDMTPSSLAGVVCGHGPGSFTSLRIAGSLCKGLAHGAGVALYTVPSLLLALGQLVRTSDEAGPGAYVVHGDALRGERYAMRAIVDEARHVAAVGGVHRVSSAGIAEFAPGSRRVAVAASGAGVFDTASAPVVEEFAIVQPDARGVLAVGDWSTCGPVSLADWEPAYGRLAEAQVVWEQKHGHALPVG